MKDTEFYKQILGLDAPWKVIKVSLNTEQQEVDIWIDHPKKIKWECTICQKKLALYDHSEERIWRHLDTCQFKTYLHARAPRVKCPEHGVRQVMLSWAEDKSRFTDIFERFAIDVLQECSILGASRILRIS